MPWAYDSFSEFSAVPEEEVLVFTAGSETEFGEDVDLSTKGPFLSGDDFISDEEYEVGDSD